MDQRRRGPAQVAAPWRGRVHAGHRTPVRLRRRPGARQQHPQHDPRGGGPGSPRPGRRLLHRVPVGVPRSTARVRRGRARARPCRCRSSACRAGSATRGTELFPTFAAGSFDVVLFADVAEHRMDPGQALRDARRLLAPGGRVVASIPNCAHGDVRLMLLAGHFPCQRTGLLDSTHVRFLTRHTVPRLFVRAATRSAPWRPRRSRSDRAS